MQNIAATMHALILFLLIQSVLSTVVTNCASQAAGTPCQITQCTTDQTCDGHGLCTGGSPVDCSYLDVGHDACTRGVCDPFDGCILQVYPTGTPCDTNGNYCDTQRCNSVGECVDYHTAVTCAEGYACNPATGVCQFIPSPSATSQPTPSETPTPSNSQTRTPSHSAPLTRGASLSPSPSPTKPVSHSPTNFVHLSTSMTPAPSMSIEPSIAPSPNATRHRHSQASNLHIIAIVSAVVASLCFLIFACIVCLITGVAAPAKELDQCVLSTSNMFSCSRFRRHRSGTAVESFPLTSLVGDDDDDGDIERDGANNDTRDSASLLSNGTSHPSHDAGISPVDEDFANQAAKNNTSLPVSTGDVPLSARTTLRVTAGEAEALAHVIGQGSSSLNDVPFDR